MKIKQRFAILCGVLLVGVLAGCSEQPGSGSVKTGGDDSGIKPAADPADAGAGQSTTGASSASKVVLGVTELTSGIACAGKTLTIDQIKQWLEDESNHEPLEVVLPEGLRAGQGAIKIPADNRMTRAKIELGRQLFFDKRLSADGTVSCADCHHPDEGYARHTQFGVGIDKQTGDRNSPVSYNRILSDQQFWDGRAGSLEEQAVGPIANPIEMGNTHAKAVETIAAIEGYAIQFKRIFGEVTIDNIGKAIASFERAIVTGPSPFDYSETRRALEEQLGEAPDLQALKKDDPQAYDRLELAMRQTEKHPMSDSAKRGRNLFFSGRTLCSSCHLGANLTDEWYHNLGVGMAANPDGRFAVSGDAKDKGAFKTPTIRNVALSAPYMHDGSLQTLEAVVQWYAKGGQANPHLSGRIKKLDLSDQDQQDLVEFMKACTGDFPAIEQSQLPQ